MAGRIVVDGAMLEKAKELRHELHRHAELSLNERETKRILIDFLAKNTSLELHDMGAWFYAAYRSPERSKGPRRIAFRADMDALPIDEGCSLAYSSKTRGVSHKCGHDGHSASLAAFALAVDRCGCENDIFFLFQHAEENGAGAAVCEALIALEHIDEIYGCHNMPGFPMGSVAVHDGVAACASTGLVLKLTGRNSHASQPENGLNPAYALAELIGAIPSLVDEAAEAEGTAQRGVPGFAMSDTGVVMCTVVGAEVGSKADGGGTNAFGTSAGFARLMLTVRAEDESRLERLKELLIERLGRLAHGHGLAAEHELADPFPETRNDPACAEKVRRAAERAGLPPARWDEPFRSSEDFGRYTKLIPGALFYIGCGESHAPLHTVSYDFSDELIAFAAEMFAQLAE